MTKARISAQGWNIEANAAVHMRSVPQTSAVMFDIAKSW